MHPLAALIVLVLLGIGVVAYLAGFSTGEARGHRRGKDEGHEEGKQEGRKEESIRAFAVGYDRGKREGDSDDDGGEKTTPSFWTLIAVAVLTVAALTIASKFLPPG